MNLGKKEQQSNNSNKAPQLLKLELMEVILMPHRLVVTNLRSRVPVEAQLDLELILVSIVKSLITQMMIIILVEGWVKEV